ncbi:MAG TPA: type II toxin-antitoxin system VapC family toxin [Ramlibacter sp.]|uniref:type II toxin-antitoxin system VapC family toxin n=1 Tax=Ramlibacter sp. TaxID=1917967 RepID=UPI002BA6D7B5|nr:type II toxin-antitoxin system VapC family toxin [Ramlibacter sp.]HVZ42725.1 type II toxin-antitoxin system VapC family toxin [Ramlibacter sp.]
MTAARLHIAEPPQAYRMRPPLVVDCSVIASTAFSESTQAETDAQIAGRELFAPYLLQYEMANVAWKKSRQGLDALAAEALEQFGAMAIRLFRIDEAEVVSLGLQYRITAYDASYLWLAAQLKCPLATLDMQLAEASRRHLANLGAPDA